jgi:hypothetical protein
MTAPSTIRFASVALTLLLVGCKEADHGTGTGLPAVPAAPSDLTVEAIGLGRIDLRWKDNSNDEAIFLIEFRQESDSSWTKLDSVLENITTYSHTELAAGTTFSYRVKACDQNGCSPATPERSATALGPGPVVIGPEGGTVIGVGGRVRLSIPPGALTTATTVSLDPESTKSPPALLPGKSVSVTWKASPVGTEFLRGQVQLFL